MGFFSGLFRGRDAPVNRTAGSSYSFFMGGSLAGKNVNERSAMQITAVYAASLSIAADAMPSNFLISTIFEPRNLSELRENVPDVSTNPV